MHSTGTAPYHPLEMACNRTALLAAADACAMAQTVCDDVGAGAFGSYVVHCMAVLPRRRRGCRAAVPHAADDVRERALLHRGKKSLLL